MPTRIEPLWSWILHVMTKGLQTSIGWIDLHKKVPHDPTAARQQSMNELVLCLEWSDSVPPKFLQAGLYLHRQDKSTVSVTGFMQVFYSLLSNILSVNLAQKNCIFHSLSLIYTSSFTFFDCISCCSLIVPTCESGTWQLLVQKSGELLSPLWHSH